MEEQKQRLMSQVPATAAGFNRDLKAMKKNTTEQLAYIKRIPIATIKGYFTKTELDTQTFSEVLQCMAEKLSGAEECTWAIDFMLTLSKSFKFDVTIMFLEDEENEFVS
mmetsp:Transcript_8207/g.11366  ORF Transcript_8207/g.11366 Transcript_8207/m.11366 type:complete len:109 (-) Transcript_8207:178-504(-)